VGRDPEASYHGDETRRNMNKQKKQEFAGRRMVAGVFVFMVGFYEHSWLNDPLCGNCASPAFYISASWVAWIVGACLFTFGLVSLVKTFRE
jgi:uncharacterized membrane protein YiaA